MFSKSDRNAKTSAKERSMRMVFSNSSITPPSEVSIKEAALFVLLSAAHQNAIDDDEDGKGDGKAAVASSIQGRDGRAEDDQLDPSPTSGTDTGARGAANSPQSTAAKSGAPIPSAVLVTGPPPVCTPQ